LGDGELRRIELSQRRRALNQGNLGPPHPREVKLSLRDNAGALEHDCILAVAGDLRTRVSSCFATAALEVMLEVRPWRWALRLARFLPAPERGPVLLCALRRLAAICRSLAMVRPPLSARWLHLRVEEHPWRRCRHKSLTDRQKPSDGCCPNCASWTDTSVALLRSETERFAGLLVEEIRWTICNCSSAKRSQFL